MRVENKTRGRGRVYIIVGIILVLVAGGVGGWLWWRASHNLSSSAVQGIIQNARNLKNHKKYDLAVKTISDAYGDVSNKQDRYLMALEVGSIYETKHECKGAVEWYEKAADFKSDDRGSTFGLARCYQALGDNEKAADKYRMLIEMTDMREPGADNDINYYKLRLSQVEGK